MSDMELRALLYFEAVARHGGFTRAAEALHVAQPSVSAQVRRLEKSLGVDLFVRTTRSVRLTPAGEHLLRRVHRITDELEAARQEMAAHATVLTGHLRVGTTPIVGDLGLPDLLARYRLAHPGVSMEVSSSLVATLLDRLADGELDVVVGPEHAPDARFESRRVASEGFVLVTGPHDGRTITTLGQVSSDPFVCLPRGSGLRALLTEAAAAADFTANIAVETHSPQSMRELVSAGAGTALIAESVATGPGLPVRVHRLRDAPEHPSISVFLARGRVDPAARAFVELVAAACRPLQ